MILQACVTLHLWLNCKISHIIFVIDEDDWGLIVIMNCIGLFKALLISDVLRQMKDNVIDVQFKV